MHQKIYLKVAGGRMHNPHPTPLDPLLAISYRNHHKSLAYFSHLAPLVVLSYNKAESKRGAWPNAPPLPPKNAPAMGNAKIFPQLMFKSRGLAKISERRLQPLLVREIAG